MLDALKMTPPNKRTHQIRDINLKQIIDKAPTCFARTSQSKSPYQREEKNTNDNNPNKKVHIAKFSLPAFEYFPKNPSKAW